MYLLSFTFILLVVLWLFQIVYLNSFYKNIKRNELTKAANMAEKDLNDDDAEYEISELASSFDICILVTKMNFVKIYSADYLPNCSIHKMDYSTFLKYKQEVENNNGSLEVTFEGYNNLTFPDMPAFLYKDSSTSFQNSNSDNNTNNSSASSNSALSSESENINSFFDKNDSKYDDSISRRKKAESVIIFKEVTINNEKCMLMLNSIITPVDATKNTLQVQLMYISIIMVLLSLIIAFIMSKKISKPIIKINDSAKELAKGHLNVAFDGNSYLEIAELSDTLNYATTELNKTESFQKELIANVSHDLRTPLTMIIGYAEVMRDLPGENTPENVQVIIDEATRLTNLVNDLLDISKLQTGVMQLEADEYDLTASISRALARYNKLIEQDGFKIIFNHDEHVFIYGDEFKLFQVIYNLVNNAINYTGEDKIVTINQIVNDDHVLIEIIDTGFGIAPEDLNNVWQRYYKVDKTHKRSIKGTGGLGLSIVKDILELHNAEYGVESTLGKGTKFWFQLKLTR